MNVRALFERPAGFLRSQVRDLTGGSVILVDEWAIGVVNVPAVELITGGTAQDVTWLVPPEGRYYADPFAIEKDGVTYIFFEDYDFDTQAGRISVVETADLETFGEARPVLERPFHLSYPYVFEYKEHYYCVPEQSLSGAVALYEIEDFPDTWVERATLIDGFPGVDPTLIQSQGLWWMFLVSLEADLDSDLYIYWADDLFGPWQPHRKNPIVSPDGLARPGGNPFRWGDRLLRPAQNGSKTYGGNLVIKEITTLTKTEFEERSVAQLAAEETWPYSKGLHTMSALGGRTVIDSKRLVARRLSSKSAVIGKLKGVRSRLKR